MVSLLDVLRSRTTTAALKLASDVGSGYQSTPYGIVFRDIQQLQIAMNLLANANANRLIVNSFTQLIVIEFGLLAQCCVAKNRPAPLCDVLTTDERY